MSQRGDTEAAFASAAVKVDETYVTPVETHNPMEMHATVAVWDGKKYTLYESSQGVMNHRAVMAQVLGVPVENVRVVTRFLGSGFGGMIFSLVTGWLVDHHSFQPAFVLFGVIPLIAALLVWTLPKEAGQEAWH